jgi:hypothetical protein
MAGFRPRSVDAATVAIVAKLPEEGRNPSR